jgi:hypothetical protein
MVKGCGGQLMDTKVTLLVEKQISGALLGYEQDTFLAGSVVEYEGGVWGRDDVLCGNAHPTYDLVCYHTECARKGGLLW